MEKKLDQKWEKQEHVEQQVMRSREHVLATGIAQMFAKLKDFLKEIARAFAEDASAPGLVE